MNSFDAAALLAQAPGTVEKGFFALATVQGLGVVLAIGLTIYSRNAHACRIPKHWHLWMQIVVWGVFGLTILVAACQRDFAPALMVDFGGDPCEWPFLYWFDLNTAHLIYFLADFGALAFLIYATGGPQHSLYTTFLFVLVPISIALGKPNVPTVILFAAITLFIFLTLLCAKPPKYFSASENGNRVRKVWLGVVTTACVFFPTLVFCIQNFGSGDNATGALSQQTGVETVSTSPGDLEHIPTPGDHDGDSRAAGNQ